MANNEKFPLNQCYTACIDTGLITGIAAATAAAGHIGAFRWSSTTKRCFIQRTRAVWITTTGFTAAQSIGLDCQVLTGYSANHAENGGTKWVGSAVAPGNNFKRDTGQPDSVLAGLFTSGTAALTDGTHAAPAFRQLFRSFAGELATGAGVFTANFAAERNLADDEDPGYRLNADEGLVLRNLILMGAGGVARVVWYIDWAEVPN